MKDNSQKILLALYSDNLQQPTVMQYDQLSQVLPESSSGGIRSLVRHLVRGQLVHTDTVAKRTYLHITRHGMDRLKRQFPALWWQEGTWSGEWSCLVFLQAPHSDPGFRYLRSVLLQEQAMQLARGVYLAPDKFPEKIMTICRDLYVGSVAIVSVSEWQFGDERSVAVNNFSLSAVAESYSEISSEVNQLLQQKQNQKSSDGAFIQFFSSVFDRFCNTVRKDNGLTAHYFPSITPPAKLLQRLQRLLEK